MLSYATPATIARNNAEAERILKRKLVGSEPEPKVNASAKAAELLASRNRG